MFENVEKFKKEREKEKLNNEKNVIRTKKLFIKWLETKRLMYPDNNQLNNYDEFIFNPEWLKYIQITTRGDGKTPSHLSAMLALSILSHKKGYSNPFIGGVIVRHHTLKAPIAQAVEQYFYELELPINFNKDGLILISSPHYIEVTHKDYGLLMLIMDLTDSSDLKHYSNLLRKISLYYVDEFLALPRDYSSTEAFDFNTIFRTTAKTDTHRFLTKPKISMAGNPINLGSPFIPAFRLTNALNKTKLNDPKFFPEIKTYIELRKNENVIESVTNEMFFDIDEGGSDGSFNFNLFNITDVDYPNQLNISIGIYVLHIHFKPSPLDFNLEIDSIKDNVTLTFNLEDESESIKFLDINKFWKQKNVDKFHKRNIKFKNNYTKSVVINDIDIKGINFIKLIKIYGYELHFSNNKDDVKKVVKMKDSELYERMFLSKFGG